MPIASRLVVASLALCCALIVGCRSATTAAPDYSQPLPHGTYGLRMITDPSRLPDLTPAAAQLGDPAFREALGRSVEWYGRRWSPQFFPSGPISHAHAWTSAYAIQAIADEGLTREQALSRLREEFDVWESVGWDGSGDVLFTGYYSPVFEASHTRQGPFQFPLYTRPPDLKSDPVSGAVIGDYPGRAELMTSGRLDGLELVYLPSRLDAYIIEVNGSAKLTMTDGTTMYVGYAGTNGHDYTSLRQLMVDAGVLDKNVSGLPAIRAYFQAHPQELEGYIRQNQRFIFFRKYGSASWPAGSLGVKVTPMRSLATDKTIFPRGAVVFVDTTIPQAGSGGTRPFTQLMLDQDTGGAIRAAGRGDIFIGIGDEAEALAGRQAAHGRLYYLLLKRHRVQPWYDQLMQAQATASAARPASRPRGEADSAN